MAGKASESIKVCPQARQSNHCPNLCLVCPYRTTSEESQYLHFLGLNSFCIISSISRIISSMSPNSQSREKGLRVRFLNHSGQSSSDNFLHLRFSLKESSKDLYAFSFYDARTFARRSMLKSNGFSVLQDFSRLILDVCPFCSPTILLPCPSRSNSTVLLPKRLAKSRLRAVGLPPL